MRLRNVVKLSRALLDKKQRIVIAGALAAYEKTPNAKCPCCGYFGRFLPFGITNRPGAYCPECGALERHRQIQLAFDAKFFEVNAKRVLHFAPEMPVRRMILRGSPAEYKTADIVPGLGDLTLNIEHLELAPDSFDLILCSHVLEHVDDRAALSEMFRVLSSDGLLIAMVPLIEGWDHTYEDRTITAPADRELHFRQEDHVRHYGRDIRERFRSAGFELAEFTAGALDSIQFGLERGEKVFRATKP